MRVEPGRAAQGRNLEMLFTRDAAKEIVPFLVRGTQRFPVAAAAARALFIFHSMTFFLFGDSPLRDPAAGLAEAREYECPIIVSFQRIVRGNDPSLRPLFRSRRPETCSY